MRLSSTFEKEKLRVSVCCSVSKNKLGGVCVIRTCPTLWQGPEQGFLIQLPSLLFLSDCFSPVNEHYKVLWSHPRMKFACRQSDPACLRLEVFPDSFCTWQIISCKLLLRYLERSSLFPDHLELSAPDWVSNDTAGQAIRSWARIFRTHRTRSLIPVS